MVLLDSIRWLISEFFDKVPTPLKYVIFLMFLFVLAGFIQFTIHLFGIHCTYEGDVVKTDVRAVLTNLQLGTMDATEVYNITSYTPNAFEDPIVGINFEVCFRAVCYGDDGEYHYDGDSRCDNNTVYPFLSKEWDWTRCVTCDGDHNRTFIQGTLGASETVTLCFGDAYPIPYDERNAFQKWVCNPAQRCVPPANYYYEYDTHTYDCTDLSVCGANVTELVPRINEELNDAGAELLYDPNIGDNDYRKTILFKCSKDNQPTLTLYGIPLFDFKIWLILFVLAILIGLLFKLR